MEQDVVSSFFNNTVEHSSVEDDISNDFLNIIDELNVRLEQFKIPSKVQTVYNPTIYARHTFEMYVRKYCNTPKPIVYFGMNPGPWGMSQTGVPFGEVNAVRDWLGIEGPVEKPSKELQSRPVLGFECTRSEISGKRFWGLIKNICTTPENFFQSSFVYNFLPQQWMTETGRNITPSDFRASELQELYSICNSAFIKVLDLYKVEKIVAVGKFCETRAVIATRSCVSPIPIQILYLPHPSPRAVNNNNWEQKSYKLFDDLGLLEHYLQK